MPPKQPTIRNGAIQSSSSRRNKGFASDTYNFLTDAENRSVVTSVAFFAAGVAFLHSSWAEILLPP
ncbi:hypothetical protein M409DRAFT_24037 [Zasmidium cellare ATCC 36951]|uniref:TOM core complex subunit Tom6 n=1 Tax=Zasmidium cellare ATCC 36951 TaxID=1080233 RepID=A0A6A6CJ69_ZASCE|nr:uncharacterized protein M409DRAFT_24037 [Zasmidium cellare ATCC 36951]KAF2165749.1 hypothetical protein M409DRAFT_24037 [Zasmidium cellare ATCC 36951]